jgi:hypothetical protein
MSKQTAIQLLKENIDSEMKLGTKMVVNWDMYLAMEKEQIVDAVDSIQIVNRMYYKDGTFLDDKAGQEIHMMGREYIGLSTNGEAYYNETYGDDK